MWLLHEIDNTGRVFMVSSHYFSGALASNFIESKHPPLVSKNPQLPSILVSRMHLLTPLLQPSFHSWPMHFALKTMQKPKVSLTKSCRKCKWKKWNIFFSIKKREKCVFVLILLIKISFSLVFSNQLKLSSNFWNSTNNISDKITYFQKLDDWFHRV